MHSGNDRSSVTGFNPGSGEHTTMAIKVLGIHHHAVRINDNDQPLEAVRDFYTNVLGLEADTNRPNVPGVPGWWINIGEKNQIHLMGGDFPSPLVKVPGQDPVAPHVALAVESIADVKAELDSKGIPYWTLSGVAGPDTEQLFVRDPCGNMIEMQQRKL